MTQTRVSCGVSDEWTSPFPIASIRTGAHARAPDHDRHIRDLIEQVLLTAPGERVNRPTFGTGTGQLVFAPNSDTLAIAQQKLIQAGLQQWLSDLIQVQSVAVENDDATLLHHRAVHGDPDAAQAGGAVRRSEARGRMIYFCAQRNRRTWCWRTPPLNGIDYLEVADATDQTCCC